MRKILPISVAALIVGALAFSGCQDTFTVNNKFDSVSGPDYVKVTYHPGANYVEWPEVPTANDYTVHRQLVRVDGDEQDWPWVALTETPVTNKDGLKAVVDTTSASNVITAGRQYRYKVVTTAAGHNLGTGETESEVNDGEVALAAPTSLPAVTNLAASVIANGQLRVSWTANTNPGVSYDLTVGSSSYNPTNAYQDVTRPTTSQVISVRAKFSGVTPVYSPLATITYSASTANFSLEQQYISNNTYNVRLSWNVVAGATGYKVFRATYDNNVTSAYTQVATATNSDAVTNVIIKSDNPSAYRQAYSYKLVATINEQDVEVGIGNTNNTSIYKAVQFNTISSTYAYDGNWSDQRSAIYFSGNAFSNTSIDLRSNESIDVYRRVSNSAAVSSWVKIGNISYSTYNLTGTDSHNKPNNSIAPNPAPVAGVAYEYKCILRVGVTTGDPANTGTPIIPPDSGL